MKQQRRSVASVSALVGLLTGCAGPQQAAGPQRTIEPVAGGTATSSNEGDFVLSRKSKPASGPALEDMPPLHVGEDWWRFRAEFLRTTVAQVKERDNAISDKQPPPVFWDQQTAMEGAAVWGTLCNECHGGRRALEDAMKMPPPPAGWGRGAGLFFGNRRPYEALFHVVYNGGPDRNGKRSEMPPWRGKLAREQIWAILYFLEYQSGGIEGRFPPSLYPRMRGEAGQ
jgi:mono/diheme cytochrome c family protein